MPYIFDYGRDDSLYTSREQEGSVYKLTMVGDMELCD